MTRAKHHRRPKPRPGAATLAMALDKKIAEKSADMANTLVERFLAGNPTAMSIIAKWAQDAEFGEQCVKIHGKTLRQIADEIEAEQAKAEALELAESTSGLENPEILAPETPLPATRTIS